MDPSPNQPGTEPTVFCNSYRLHGPHIHLHIAVPTLTLKLHTFSCKFNIQQHGDKQLQITLAHPLPQDTRQLQKLIVQTMLHVQSYQISGGMVRFNTHDISASGNHRLNILFRGRYDWIQEQHRKLDGDWKVQPINLALQVRGNQFQIQGATGHKYTIKFQQQNKKIKFDSVQKVQERPGCSQLSKTYDKIFLTALKLSCTWQPGQVSFRMFDAKGNETARGTPYM